MKGRQVSAYPVERIAAARAIKETHGAAMVAAAATLPTRIRLSDGRKLVMQTSVAGGYGYRCNDGMVALASYDPTPHGLLLHVSISYANRDPSWHDLKLIRAAFFPADKDVIQILPRAGEYVNVHAHCFHLFEAPAEWQGGWNV